LLLTDIKYSLYQNPVYPAYSESGAETENAELISLSFIDCSGGQVDIGHDGKRFCFDNELPRHAELIGPFQLANRLVTNGEFMQFVDAGGYRDPEYWLSDGWAVLQTGSQHHPLYWQHIEGQWFEYSLHGLQPLDKNLVVSHVSYFEAQAYASWAGKRLPTEGEWESVARVNPLQGNFLDSSLLQPRPPQANGDDILQLFGDCWEWTNSAYLPYPGYRLAPGAVGEYNGKFMSGQMVLRGGSCLSNPFHIRPSYRNFFYPGDRWQCSGIRLAADI
jgi:ergothioneine biosynthesis protein EgtB